MANVLTILLKAVDEASAPISAVAKSVSHLHDNGLVPLQHALGVGLKAAAMGAVAGLGALAGGIWSSVSAASDMEQALADISASMGTSAEETAQLKGLIGDLGMDPTLKVSATEAAAAIGTLGTAGVSVTDILNGAAKSTVLLANSTGADFASAAAMASDTMKLFGIDAKDMKTAVDGITSVTVASKFGIDDYRLALANAGGMASAVGVEFDDFNTAIAGIAPKFSGGAEAGTGFRSLLQRLVPQSKTATEEMQRLGMITKDGSNRFYDANGNLKSMAEIAEVLQETIGGLSEQQKNSALTTIFGADAMNAALGIAEQGVVVYADVGEAAKALGVSIESLSGAAAGGITAFEALQVQMAKTDAEESARKRMETFKGSMEILAGTFDAVKMQIGDAFLPMFTDMSNRFSAFLASVAPQIQEWATAFAQNLEALVNWIMAVVEDGDTMNDWLTHMSPALQNVVLGVVNLVDWVRNAIVVIRDVAAPIAEAISKFVSWKDILGAVAIVAASAVIPALGAFVTAAWPVVAVAATLVAGVSALRYAWESDFNGIRTLVSSSLTYLRDLFGPVLNTIRNFGGDALREIVAWASGNQTQFTAVTQIWNQVKATAQAMFSDMVAYVRTNIPVWSAQLAEWGRAAWQWVVDATQPALGKLAEWGGALLRWLVGQIPTLISTMLQWATALVTWIGESLPKAIEQFSTWLTGIMNWGSGTGRSAFGQMIVDFGVAMVTQVGPALLKLAEALLTALAQIVLAVAEGALKIGWSIISNIAQALFDWKGIEANLSGIRDGMIANISGWTAPIRQKADLLVPAIRDGINAFARDPVGAINGVFDGLSGAINGRIDGSGSLKDRLFTGARESVVRMKDGFNSVANDPVGAIQAIVGGVVSAFNAVMDGFKNHAGGSVRDLLGRISGGLTSIDLGAVLRTALNGLIDAFNGMMDGFKNHTGASTRDLLGRIGGALTSVDLGGTLRTALNGMLNAFNGMMDGFKNHASSGVQDLMGRMRSALGGDLAGGMRTALQGIIDAFNGVMDGFRNHVSGVMSGIGGNIINGIKSGITSGLHSLYNTLSSMADSIPQWVRDALGINSPSKVFMELGKNVMQGFTLGIEQLSQMPQLAIAGVADGVISTGNSALSGGTGGTTINNTQSRTNNFSVSLAGGSATDPFETTRLLNALYGGASA